jgi:hypothetical protein
MQDKGFIEVVGAEPGPHTIVFVGPDERKGRSMIVIGEVGCYEHTTSFSPKLFANLPAEQVSELIVKDAVSAVRLTEKHHGVMAIPGTTRIKEVASFFYDWKLAASMKLGESARFSYENREDYTGENELQEMRQFKITTYFFRPTGGSKIPDELISRLREVNPAIEFRAA